jgi:hypothetical protein
MRVGTDAALAAGRERFSRTRAAPGAPPGGHYEPPATSWPPGPTARRALRPKCEARRGQRTAPAKQWRAMRRPRLSRGSAAQNEQWLRHLARHLPHLGEGDRSDDGAPGAKKNTGDAARPCCLTIEYVIVISIVMPALVAGIHVFTTWMLQRRGCPGQAMTRIAVIPGRAQQADSGSSDGGNQCHPGAR